METIAQDNLISGNLINASYVEQGMSYDSYRRLINDLIEEGRTTSKNQSVSLLEYSKLNVVRMNRLDKKTEIIPELVQTVKQVSVPQTWLVITEGWCGDAAQIVPVLNKIALLNRNIHLKFLLRDENLDLMDAYLTRGESRSIPKLILLDANNEEIFNWGPRPNILQELFYHMKANAVPNNVIKEEMHKWYARDKTIAIQKDILALLKKS